MSLVEKWVGNGQKHLKINMAVSVFIPSRERTWKLRNLRWETLKCELEVEKCQTMICSIIDNVLTPLFFLRHALLQTMAHFSWHFWHAVRHIEWHTRTHPPVRFECITTPPVVSIRHHDSRTNRINSELFMLIYKNIQKETIWNILSLCLRVIGRNMAFYQDISRKVILFRNI